MWLPSVPRSIASAAVHQLALVDYAVANKVTEDAATIIDWAYSHDMPQLAICTMNVLQKLDEVGSFLIFIVVWLVSHTM